MTAISIQQAIALLRKGQLVALPTETVYGLAARFDLPLAIDALYALKGRPKQNPLIVHIADLTMAAFLTEGWPPATQELMEQFWPGPLTLLLPAQPGKLLPSVIAGLPRVALRMPATAETRAIIEAAGPLVMPSANLSGRPSATEPAHVEADFGVDFPLVDLGKCPQGVESTVLAWDQLQAGWHIVRHGALPPERLSHFLGPLFLPINPQVAIPSEGQPICPGQLLRHYAPAARLHIARQLRELPPGSALLGWEGRAYPQEAILYSLGRGDPETTAARLYQLLRQLDCDGVQVAWVDGRWPASDGLWTTIIDRFERAAAASGAAAR